MLARYATRLNAVEINSSFYRPHQRKTYARWASSVPDDFRFSVKLPRTITHEKRLKDFEPELECFAGEVGGLGAACGAVLVQLPPSLGFDEAVARAAFRRILHSVTAPVVCEPRHASWFDGTADAALAALGIARAAADPSPSPGARKPGGDSSLVYLRLHGAPVIYRSNYDAMALAAVCQEIDAYRARAETVWCVFDNTAEGHALGNALALSDRSMALSAGTELGTSRRAER